MNKNLNSGEFYIEWITDDMNDAMKSLDRLNDSIRQALIGATRLNVTLKNNRHIEKQSWQGQGKRKKRFLK